MEGAWCAQAPRAGAPAGGGERRGVVLASAVGACIACLVSRWLVRDTIVHIPATPTGLPGYVHWPLHVLSKSRQLAVPTLLGLGFAIAFAGRRTAALHGVHAVLAVLAIVFACAWPVSVLFGPRLGNVGVDSLRELSVANRQEACEFLELFVLTPGFLTRDALLSLVPGAALLAATSRQEFR